MREADHPTVIRAIGFAPGGQGTPRLAVKRLAQALDHEDVTMMATLAPFSYSGARIQREVGRRFPPR